MKMEPSATPVLAQDSRGTVNGHLEQEVDARGAAYVVLALDLRAFVEPSSRDTLLLLQGRKEFNEFLRHFDPHDPRFDRDDTYKAVEQRGYELGVFNRILAEENFAPTYRLNKERVVFPPELLNNVQFKDKFLTIWSRWNFWFRLSSNGVVTIILKLDIPKPRPLVLISRDVMGLEGHFDMDSARKKLTEFQSAGSTKANQSRVESILQFMDWVRRHAMVEIEREFPSVVWQMAVEVVHQFVDACHGWLRHTGEPLSFALELRSEPQRNGAGGLREKYVMFLMDEIGLYDWDRRMRHVIPPGRILSEPYRRTIAGLLEGILLRGKSDYYFPTHNAVHLEAVASANMSSWQDEACIVTDQSTFVYASLPKQGHTVVFPSQPLMYAKYWECVLRAFEFGVESRLLVQMAKQITSQYLEDALPALHFSPQMRLPQIEGFELKAANAARLLSHLRTITVPHIVAGAGYSVNKLALFMHQTGVPDILTQAEMNLHDLNALVERTYDVRLQQVSQRIAEVGLSFSVLVGGLSFALAALTLKNELLSSSVQTRWYYPYLLPVGEALILGLVPCGAVLFGWAMMNLLRRVGQGHMTSLVRVVRRRLGQRSVYDE